MAMWSCYQNTKDREFPGAPVIRTRRFHTAEGPGSIRGRGTKIPQATCGVAKKKKKYEVQMPHDPVIL